MQQKVISLMLLKFRLTFKFTNDIQNKMIDKHKVGQKQYINKYKIQQDSSKMSEPPGPLQSLLAETTTHPKIKQTLKLLTQTRQKITYHALVSSADTYLHLRGLASHDQDEFNYINRLLYTKIVGIMGKIKRKQLHVRDIVEEERNIEIQRQRQQNYVDQQIRAEVEHVVANVDLPVSLFKRNDKYWYHDNPKTVEAKNYVYSRIKEDRERKQKIRSQIVKKQTDKQKEQRQRKQRQTKLQQQRRQKYRQQVKNHIQQRKKRSQQRQKSISESQKYTSSLKPLFQKLQSQQQSFQLSALQEQKKRLNQLRKLHKSIDLSQIQEHKNKLLQIQKQKELKKIFNEPIKVSFKSKYHTSMTNRSRLGQQYETTKSLYEKKKEYGEIVKNQYKPKIDENLVQQMEERLKLMRRKRVRKNPKKKVDKKDEGEDDDDDEQDDDEQDRQIEKMPQPVKQVQNNNSDDSDYDSDQEQQKNKKPPKRIRGEDEDPDRHQRYELGVEYLEYVRNLRKKKKQQQQNANESKMEIQTNQKSRYKDYLKQFVRTNRSTIDHIDTDRMKSEYNKSIISNNNPNTNASNLGNRTNFTNLSRLENETHKVEAKINREEELLRVRKMKNQDAIAKKVQIDNAVIQTIKARLALMGN